MSISPQSAVSNNLQASIKPPVHAGGFLCADINILARRLPTIMPPMSPEELLQAYAGKYLLTGLGVVLEYSVVDGVLKVNVEGQPETTLTPLSQSEFKYEGVEASVEFKTDDKGEVTGAVHTQGGQKFELERVAPYEPTVEELHDTTLTLLIRNTEEIELSALKEDNYKGDIFFIGELVFQRDNTGQVTGFTAANGRTRGIVFERY